MSTNKQHTLSLHAPLVYQRLLSNTYHTSDLCRPRVRARPQVCLVIRAFLQSLAVALASTFTVLDESAATCLMIAAMTAAQQPRVTITKTSIDTRTSLAPSPETSLFSFVTSLQPDVSSLWGFSGTLVFLPKTCMTLSQFKLCTRPISLTCLQRLPLTLMILTPSLFSSILTLTLIRFKFFSMSFVGNVQGLFSCFFFLFEFSSCFSRGGLVTHNLSSLPGLAFFFVISYPSID